MLNSKNNANDNARKFRLRCTYVKQGRLAYLSHLEVIRALERCVRRARLPFAVSCGFSPHMRLHFGSALPVGIGSTCEIFDITLKEYVAPQKALEALQRVQVSHLKVINCEYVDNSLPAASVAFPFSTYEVVLSEHVQNFTFPETITLIKKKKEREMRISDFLVGELQIHTNSESESVLTFTLVSKPAGSMRPDKLVQEALSQYNNASPTQNEVAIKKFTRISQQEQQEQH